MFLNLFLDVVDAALTILPCHRAGQYCLLRNDLYCRLAATAHTATAAGFVAIFAKDDGVERFKRRLE
jgi:hypothetical protein